MEALFHAHATLLFAAAAALVGILSSLAASRFGVPILLVFLGVGMLAGDSGPGGVIFNDYGLTYLIGSAAIAIILFDGGLRTRATTIRSVLGPAGVLASVGVLLTAAITGAAAKLFLGADWVPALLIGAIVASTDAAVVFFLLRTGGLQLKRRVGATLEVESGTNDPFAVLLTVVLVEIASGGPGVDAAHVVWAVVREASLGALIGFAGGLGLVFVLNRLRLPAGLHPAFAITAALVVFALAQTIGASGFLAAYVAGLIVGNRPVRAYASIASFHDTATWLCQIALFTLLGLLVSPRLILPVLAPALAIAAVLILIARPAAVWLCLTPFRFSRREMTFISWVGLRGGVSIFLATIPTLTGMAGAQIYFNVAFVVVVASLTVQGWSIGYAARRTGVALRDPAPEVQRIEIDLPGQLDAELVGYPLLEQSPAARRRAMPSWVKPVLVVREGQILQPVEAGPLQPRDYGYFLAPTARLARLDRYFAVDGPASADEEMAEFPFDGSLPVGAIADLYGLDVGSDERGMTVAELFAQRLDDAPQENDRIDLGSATLIAHAVVDERVRLAGLILEATPEEDDAAPGPRRWRERATDKLKEARIKLRLARGAPDSLG
ncbi:potassium/proton antiporter [Alsobacter soli]|uniref:Potassium/proton antiporter n=1 Tax=Alsobacter soli TaxID=2109933 RepID=A0A2T1HNM2_9HYPH|nr:potassium/proton antiporter [Alsobacter soli]PSC03159.1 potassium/proton antiporter [Alsobacter soli]